MAAIEIPVDKIKRKSQTSRVIDAESVKNLAASIEELGQLQPIIVRPDGEGYILISGERRLEAMRLLNRETIRAIVWDGDLSPAQVELIENLQRGDIDPLTKAKALHTLLVSQDLDKKELAARLGVARTTLTEWLDILKLDEKYQRLIVENCSGGNSPITISHATIALGIAGKLQNPKLVNQLLDAVLKYRLTKSQMQQLRTILIGNPGLGVMRAVQILLRRRLLVARTVSTMKHWCDQLEEVRELAEEDLEAGDREQLLGALRSIVEVAGSLMAELQGSSEGKRCIAGQLPHA